MPHKPRIFISYSRKDGFDFARNLRNKLEKLGFSLWQDVISLEGGRDFWLQITEALDHVEFMVLVLTDGAMQSPIVRKEWRYARQRGVCVYPVKGEPFSESVHQSLPRWMRDAHYYDLPIEEQWQKLVNDLRKSCETVRVPFMVEDKPDDFVERPEEFNQLLALLLDPKREEPIAITAALRGAGGYGKTTLAKALCHDESIQNAFDDGILWVTLGENPADLTGRVEDLIYTLSGERPGFSSVQAAAARFAELLADRDILLVIDDVWNNAHLTPFLRGGSRCSRLITTRNSDTLPAKAKGIDLDAMRPDEATSLLGFNLPEGESSGLQRLAQRLGEWPLLLKLVNATLRYRVHDLQQSFAAAIAYVNAALDECGLIAFDQDNATERHQAVAKTLEVSLQMLDEGGRQRYFELAIFPEDVSIPLATLEKLWSAAGYKPIHTEKLCEKLHKLSLLLHFDLSDRTIRLHDMMRQYLVQKIGAELPKLHAQFLQVYRSTTLVQTWVNLPADEPYLWCHLAYHLVNSDQAETLRQLLLDYDWLRNKLAVGGMNSLLSDYDFFPRDEDLQLLQSALRLSANQLTRDYKQLPSHLCGRLLGIELENIQIIITKAMNRTTAPWLRLLFPSLTSASGPVMRSLEGHYEAVTSVAITNDGKLAVSASDDITLKVWNLETGECRRTLKGHHDRVKSVAITSDGKLAVSASWDKTLKVWNLETGECHRTLEGHHNRVRLVAITGDGKLAVSASWDLTLKVWNLETGECHRTLEGYGFVTSVAITTDGKLVVSGSRDGTLKVWNLETGECYRTLKGHHGSVTSVVITTDGKLVVSGSLDRTLKVWNLETGECRRTLKGHNDQVKSVAITGDGKLAVSASWDKTLKLWNLETGECHHTLKEHHNRVESVAITGDGKLAVSASWDKTLKLWNLETDECHPTLEGHYGSVTSVVITTDGKLAVSASWDKTLKLWNLETGECRHTLKGHHNRVESVAITDDGKLAVSASSDKTHKVWNLETGECRCTIGHGRFIDSAAITTDGKLAVFASPIGGTLEVWNLEIGECYCTLEGHHDSVTSVAITTDGKLVVSGSSDETLKVWNLETGECHRTLEGHHGSVTSVAITTDGKLVVSGSSDETLKVWNLETGECHHTLKGHHDRVNSVAITEDGKIAVSASYDKCLKVWDLISGEEVTSFIGEYEMDACAISIDGRTTVVGDRSGQVYFLKLEEGASDTKQRDKARKSKRKS